MCGEIFTYIFGQIYLEHFKDVCSDLSKVNGDVQLKISIHDV